MFCFQCQETAKASGCTVSEICGKTPKTANLQDLLLYVSRGLNEVLVQLRKEAMPISAAYNQLLTQNLFITITNANFDDQAIVKNVQKIIDTIKKLRKRIEDINDLPIIYNIAWYEQKAVIVLLTLLSLGVKNIHLGPTLPAFLSSNVVDLLVEQFGIAGIQTVEKDIDYFFAS